MKNFIIGMSLLVSANLGFAQQNVPYCDDPKVIIETIKEEYQEVPQLSMQNFTEDIIVIFVHKQTKEWTMVAFDKNMILGCVVSSGSNFTLLEKSTKKILM
jgi:hypothetical protein